MPENMSHGEAENESTHYERERSEAIRFLAGREAEGNGRLANQMIMSEIEAATSMISETEARTGKNEAVVYNLAALNRIKNNYIKPAEFNNFIVFYQSKLAELLHKIGGMLSKSKTDGLSEEQYTVEMSKMVLTTLLEYLLNAEEFKTFFDDDSKLLRTLGELQNGSRLSIEATVKRHYRSEREKRRILSMDTLKLDIKATVQGRQAEAFVEAIENVSSALERDYEKLFFEEMYKVTHGENSISQEQFREIALSIVTKVVEVTIERLTQDEDVIIAFGHDQEALQECLRITEADLRQAILKLTENEAKNYEISSD